MIWLLPRPVKKVLQAGEEGHPSREEWWWGIVLQCCYQGIGDLSTYLTSLLLVG